MSETIFEKTSENGLPFNYANRFGVVLTETESISRVSYKKELPFAVLAELHRIAKNKIDFQYMDSSAFEAFIASAYSRDSSEAKQIVEDLGEELDLVSIADSVPENEDLLGREDDAPIIRLINAVLTEAIRENASDVHVETFEKELIVRFRVDGVMREIVKPKRELAPLLISRIKVMAKLDIAEKRIPQDGRISLKIGGREVDVRVSTMPANNSERVVMRLLDKQAGRLDLENLGMDIASLKRLQSIVHRPHGIFLVTGPTGSGKTTTLYASLSELSTKTINILTVEDPIEYQLSGIGQTQVNNKADMTFARGLRAILRQDPDVVMVGEIRDLETAEIAVQASLTGHLVMSTLHTNTAVGAIARLMDMGVEPFLLSSSLTGILAQRLVRRLCDSCKKERPATTEELTFLKETRAVVFEGVGCESCARTGYSGRTGIYELVSIDEQMRKLIHDQNSEQDLAKYAMSKAPNIKEDGKQKILNGTTTVQEVLRVTLDE